MAPVILQSTLRLVLGAIVAAVTVLGAIIGAILWIQKKRWSGVNSAQKQESYLRDHFEGSSYAAGPLTGTITNVKVIENSGIWYGIKKVLLTNVSGTTKVTMRFDGAAIPSDRLDKEPFTTVFANPSDVGLIDADHLRTEPNPDQGHTLIQIQIDSIAYDDVGSWCNALPKFVWDVYETEHNL